MNKFPLTLLLLVACQPSTDSINQPPTDLAIVNPIWTRTDPNHLYQEDEHSEHDFTIKNSSDRFSYDQIVVRLSYFDHHRRLLHEYLHNVRRQIRPHESYRVKGMYGGVVKPGTKSATVNLVKATKQLQPGL